MGKMKYLFLLLILLIPISVQSAEVSFKDTLHSAINNSFDLKMSTLDIGISKAQLSATRADWYPTLSLQFNSEYNKDLQNGKGTYAYAGNTMIIPYTQYRDMLYFTVSYNLLDFGIQGKKVNIAKKELLQKEVSYNMQLKELKLKILDLYTKAQISNNAINTKKEILLLYENMFKNKERMFKAGINNKLTVMDEAVKIAKTQNEIETSLLELKEALEDLSHYTNIKYDVANLSMLPIDDEFYKSIGDKQEADNPVIQTKIQKREYNFEFDPNNTDEAKYYDLEIEKKESELSILKRQLLPSFRVYTGYSLYGQNPNNYYTSYQDISQRSFVVGISSQYTLFDGFKNRANRKKTKLEIEKLKVEKEKKLSELTNRYQKSVNSYETYSTELENNKKMLINVKDKYDAVNRLIVRKLTEQA